MSNIKTFLKVLNKVGYPNSNINTISNAVSYDLDNFLPDLITEVGEDKANWFVGEAISKLSTKKGIKLNLSGEYNEYAYIIIKNSRIDLENSDDTVLIDWSWGDTHLLTYDEEGNDSYQTIEQISDQVDMGEWGDYDDLIDSIQGQLNDFIYGNCGFGIWFDTHI